MGSRPVWWAAGQPAGHPRPLAGRESPLIPEQEVTSGSVPAQMAIPPPDESRDS